MMRRLHPPAVDDVAAAGAREWALPADTCRPRAWLKMIARREGAAAVLGRSVVPRGTDGYLFLRYRRP